MNILVYTQRSCPACTNAKALLNSKGQTYKESVIGEDILREDFMATFPEIRTVPFIVIDGVKIGGYNELREYFDNRPEYLAG